MIEHYRKIKAEEARIAQLKQQRQEIDTIANLTDIDLKDPAQGLSLRERINDLEVALCELLDSLA